MGVVWLLLLAARALAEEDWVHRVQTAVNAIRFPQVIVDRRLAEDPHDVEARMARAFAHGLTAGEAASEYVVLDAFPHDEDVLISAAMPDPEKNSHSGSSGGSSGRGSRRGASKPGNTASTRPRACPVTAGS